MPLPASTLAPAGNMERVLRSMIEYSASDIFLTANTPIMMNVNGQMLPLTEQALAPAQPRQLLAEVLTPIQLEELDDTGEINVGIGLSGVGSFRLSGFKQRGTVAAVFRCIPHDVPAMASLKMPTILDTLAIAKRGLVLLVGATGTGKSTTLAAMIEKRNQLMTGHILTIEDPIEFTFRNKKSVINQREVGRDTKSLQVGLRNALRQAPDCILIGEIRDRETMTSALSYALSGHLVLSTLHANNSYHALSRVTSFYPPESRSSLLSDLAASLRAIVSQRLLLARGGGRIPAAEVLLNTTLIAEMIEQGDFSSIREAMVKSMADGSQTFEQDIARLIGDDLVTREEGIAHADSPSNLMWRLQNDLTPQTRLLPPIEDHEDGASFTDIAFDAPRG